MIINHSYKTAKKTSCADYIIFYYTFLILFIFSVLAPEMAYTQINQGLYFYSHESTIENRTSLLLQNGYPYLLKDKDIFSLNFDVDIRISEAQRFGYIFKIISNKKESYNLVLNTKNEVFFVLDDKQDKKEDFKKINIGNNEHLKIEIVFDKRQNQISLHINEHKVVYKNDLQMVNSLLINFGKCAIDNFKTNDVPPIILRNVRVHYNGELANQWLFDNYNQHITYDHIHHKKAVFSQGKMLVDHSIHWQKIGSFKAKKAPQITFDSVSNQVFVLDDKQLLSFTIVDQQLSQTAMRHTPTDLLVNRLVYDYTTHELLSYNFSPQRLNYFDPETGSWDVPIEEEHEYYHHNRHVSLKDSSLYLYGGYGHYRYKGFLYKIDLRTGKWQTKDLSSDITPRYLAAMGVNKTDDKLYILGGKGAEMGLQELSPMIFFDLYEVDLHTLRPKLLYKNEKEQQKDLLFSNSLIIDDSNAFLYTLAFPAERTDSYLQLKKIGISEPTIADYADSIPFYFKDDASYCDLFFSPSLSKLIAVTAVSKDGIDSEVSVYSLNFPPLQWEDIHLVPAEQSFSKTIAAILFIMLAAVGIFLYRIKVRRLRSRQPDFGRVLPAQNLDELNPADTVSVTDAITIDPSVAPLQYYHLEKSAIRLLGAFQVFDKDGKEITENFSPILKYLLILLLLYTSKYKRGISSSKLEEILWFGKSEKSALNNRNVNLSKLRALLENFGQVEIVNNHGYWSISLPEEALADYSEILELCQQLHDNPQGEIEQVYRLVELLSFGELLPEIQYEWIDSFKSDFSTLIIDTLLFIIKVGIVTVQKDASTLLKIADIILIFDPINEDAIKVKCKTLYTIGKKSLAKSAYEHFSKRYLSLLDEEFTGTLKEMIE